MAVNDAVNFHPMPLWSNTGCCAGTITEINDKGQVFVNFSGSQTGPVQARVLMNLPLIDKIGKKLEIPVALLFEQSDPSLPVVIGVMSDSIFCPDMKTKTVTVEQRPIDAVIDGQKIVFKAEDEIVLQCGKSSIILQKNGKLIVKGENIISRSSGVNKMKGTTVCIN